MRRNKILFSIFFICLSTAGYVPRVYLGAVKACRSINYDLMKELLQQIQHDLLVASAQADGSYELYMLNAPRFKISDVRDFCPNSGMECLTLLETLQKLVFPIMQRKVFLKIEESVQSRSHEYESLYGLCKLREGRHILRTETTMSYSQLQSIKISNQLYKLSDSLAYLMANSSGSYSKTLLRQALINSIKDLLLGHWELTRYWAIITHFANLLSENSNKCAVVRLTTTIEPPKLFKNTSRLEFTVAYRNYIWKKGQMFAKQAGMPFPINVIPHDDSLASENLDLNVTHQQLHPGAIAIAIKLLVLLDAIPHESMWPLRHRIAFYLESLERICIQGAQDLLNSRVLQRKIEFSRITIFIFTVRANPRMLPAVIPIVNKSKERVIITLNISSSLKTSVMEEWLKKVQALEGTTFANGDSMELVSKVLGMLPAKFDYF